MYRKCAFILEETIKNLKNMVAVRLILDNFLDSVLFSRQKKYSDTGCPNEHGNSVTHSISSFQIIL